MPLTSPTIAALKDAIDNYNFPACYYDFKTNTDNECKGMAEVERVIGGQLRSQDPLEVRHGLANVIYWGNATAGYQWVRTQKTLNQTTAAQIEAFQNFVSLNASVSLKDLRSLAIPQFSGISFLSKILMFLYPENRCVLDLLISRLGKMPGDKAIHSLITTTTIRVSRNNVAIYDRWCQECADISKNYFNAEYRVVDIERGFFSLIRQNKLELAQVIYRDA